MIGDAGQHPLGLRRMSTKQLGELQKSVVYTYILQSNVLRGNCDMVYDGNGQTLIVCVAGLRGALANEASA
jgi:hypothetical protein